MGWRGHGWSPRLFILLLMLIEFEIYRWAMSPSGLSFFLLCLRRQKKEEEEEKKVTVDVEKSFAWFQWHSQDHDHKDPPYQTQVRLIDSTVILESSHDLEMCKRSLS